MKHETTARGKMQNALIDKMINQFQRTENQSSHKKVNPFIPENKNSQDLSKFFGPIESKVTKKKKKLVKDMDNLMNDCLQP